MRNRNKAKEDRQLTSGRERKEISGFAFRIKGLTATKLFFFLVFPRNYLTYLVGNKYNLLCM